MLINVKNKNNIILNIYKTVSLHRKKNKILFIMENKNKVAAIENMNPNEKVEVKYQNPTPGELPIVGSGNLTSFSYLTFDFLSLQKKCGINIALASMIGNENRVFCEIDGKQQTNDTCAIYNYKDFEDKEKHPNWLKANLFANQRMSMFNAKKAEMKIFIRMEPDSITKIEGVNPSNSPWTGVFKLYNNFFKDKELDFFGKWKEKKEGETEDETEEEKKKNKKNNTIAGFWIKDEPSLSYFWGLRELRYNIIRNELRESKDDKDNPIQIPNPNHKLIIENEAVTRFPIISMLFPYLQGSNGGLSDSQRVTINGILETAGILETDKNNPVEGWEPVSTYQKYVESYVSNLEPGVVCFDSYPFHHNGDGKVMLSAGFFRSLSFYMQQRRLYGYTFWSAIQGMGVTFYKKENNQSIIERIKPVPTNGQLRFSVFCSLAFGAQGLVYWRITPGHDVTESDGFVSQKFYGAAIDRDGKPTETFNLIKEINEEVRKYQKIFLTDEESLIESTIDACVSQWPETEGKSSSESKNYYSNGTLQVFANNGIDTFGPLLNINNGANVALGLITKKYSTATNLKRQFLVVVNLDFEEMQPVNLKFTDYVRDEFSETALVKQLTVKMQPGDWRIFSRKL